MLIKATVGLCVGLCLVYCFVPAQDNRLIPKAEEPVVVPEPVISDDQLPRGIQAVQALDIPGKVDGIELYPDKVSVPSTKRFVVVAAKATGKVKWMVFNTGKVPVEWLQVPGTKAVMIFPTAGVDDRIDVYAYTTIKPDEPSDPARSTITVTARTTPDPIDVPVPDTPKPISTWPGNVTIITDSALVNTNAALSTIIKSKDLNDGIVNRGHKFWVMDQNKDVAKIKERGFDEFVRKIGKIPLYIIQDGSGIVVDSGALPTTLISILNTIDRIAPFKK